MGEKYFTVSYDDGLAQDVRIINLMRKYGIRGTFNLSSGKFGEQGKIYRILGDFGVDAKKDQTRRCVDHNILSIEEAKKIYCQDGIEIASHGTHHIAEDQLDAAGLVEEIKKDAETLSSLFDRKIEGHIFPYGKYSSDVLNVMHSAGLKYGRAVSMYQKPKDFSLHIEDGVITPTCWHLDKFALALLEKFIETPCDGEDMVFYMWGHGYELDYGTKRGNDDHLEKIFQSVARAKNIHFVTNAELMDNLHCLSCIRFL